MGRWVGAKGAVCFEMFRLASWRGDIPPTGHHLPTEILSGGGEGKEVSSLTDTEKKKDVWEVLKVK